MRGLTDGVLIFIGAGVAIYFLSQLGEGFESVIKNAPHETVVPKLNEVLERLDALERKNG